MLLRAIAGPLPTPPPEVQVSARLCAMSSSTPYLRGGVLVGELSTSTLDLAAPFVSAAFSDSPEVGARAGERHAFAADLTSEVVSVRLSETGATTLNAKIVTAVLTVGNVEGETARASVGVSLDTSRLSPLGDGGC